MKQSQTNQGSSWRSDAALFMLALIWGTSHVIQKDVLATHSPAFYTSVRFGIAALCFGALFANHLRRSERKELVKGAWLGLFSFAGIGFYTSGLAFTLASKAGFITGLYLVFTPLLGYLLFRSRPTRDHLTGLVIAVGGFALLCYPQTGESFNWGDILILFAALAWAAHIAATSAFASESDVKTLAAAQVMVVAALSITAYLILSWAAHSSADPKSLPALVAMEARSNPIDWRFAERVAYMAVVVTFIAALAQTWAQKRVSSTYAVIIYALEPAVGAVFAYAYLNEKLSWRSGAGAVLIIIGVAVSRLRLATRLTKKDAIELNSEIQPAEADL
ncbi:MAG: DMT family transporter [Chloracidobacterium sp.]|nr:DMT family transporter [Chloracidobacterium sp.]